MPSINVTLIGKKQVLGILSTLKKRVINLKPAFKQIGDNFRELEKITFDSRRPWRPLSPKYAAWKSIHHPGKPIMVLTGDLRRSLVSVGGDHIQKISSKHMEIGTANDLGLWHQEGAGKLPKRKVIKPKKSDIMEWVNIIRGYIIEKLGFKRSSF